MTRREERVRRRVAILALLTVAALMTVCAGAQAKTVQVGGPLTASFNTQVQFTGCIYEDCGLPFTATLVQTSLPEPGTHLSSPVDGTVISYRVVATDGTFAIQVVRLPIRRAGPEIATSAAQAPSPPPAPFRRRLPPTWRSRRATPVGI